MASIQQSLNQMIGATSAGILTSAHLYKASPSYQTKKIQQQRHAEAEADALEYERLAGNLAKERDDLIKKIGELKDKGGRQLTYRNKDYRELAHQLDDVHSRHAMYVKEANKVSPSPAREDAINTLPEPHESIALTKQYEAEQEEKAIQKIQQQKKAEAEALASLEFRAKTMGITTEQLKTRMEHLKLREQKKLKEQKGGND